MRVLLRYILVVDPSKLVRRIMIDSLEDLGYTVVGEAKDGEEAFAQYRLLKPDLMIMNLVMSNMSAIELIERVYNLDAEAKIIVCSSCQKDSDLYRAIKAGAKDFLLKPFNVEHFNELVSKLS